MEKPVVTCLKLPSGSRLVRFTDISDAYWYDNPINNPRGHAIKYCDEDSVKSYFKDRSVLTESKLNLIKQAKAQMSADPDFLSLVYKGASLKRKFDMNKFVGNLSIVDYAKGSDKMFRKSVPGGKKQTLNLAFQVGTFVNGNYTQAFIKILKTIMMCQAMNISVNIDVFDSDVSGIGGDYAYCIINIAKSSEKLDFRKILIASHQRFFDYTLFNGYSAFGLRTDISGFIGTQKIIEDLGPRYDVIGGNLLSMSEDKSMVSQILKIGLNGR